MIQIKRNHRHLKYRCYKRRDDCPWVGAYVAIRQYDSAEFKLKDLQALYSTGRVQRQQESVGLGEVSDIQGRSQPDCRRDTLRRELKGSNHH
ncbi:hypothetical protein [Neptunomonas antarctica]|uniref:hypothetical protein n=1 Tax=Neptunomonas antarctica TaxID=619304 RepID=UPI00118150E6|nr:hypothetical protein [Neptunomonas antarctica]